MTFLKHFFQVNYNYVNRQRNLAAINHVADLTSSKVFVLDAGEFISGKQDSKLRKIFTELNGLGRARDGAHPGFEIHQMICDEFYKKINETE